ncbi:MAG TPA: hypothetical protein VG537_00675, partial [Candidatus Kapabacteria bacterium]|nr:hypothetical protein [Candidatus Kapabacteria bacterium]
MSIASTAASPAIIPVLQTDYNVSRANGYSSRSLAEDDAFWMNIREEFPIVHELIYMNNGTMGPSPRMVTERVISRIQHVDTTGDYGGDYEAIRGAIARVLHAESGD